jgi:hypothetical protein
MGKKVLAVDFDSQTNLTTCFGVENPAKLLVTIGHLMMTQMDDEERPDASEYIMSRNGVDFIPSSMMLSAVDLSYLTEDEQKRVSEKKGIKLDPKTTKVLKDEAGGLTEIVDGKGTQKSVKEISIRISAELREKYFTDASAKDVAVIVEQALTAWFESEMSTGA